MRTVLATTGVLAAALLVGVGAYVSQADPAAPATSTGTGAGATLVLDDSARPTPTPSPSASPSATPEAGDDNGGLLDRDLRTEPGDDRDAAVADDDDSRDDRSGRGGDDDGPDHD